MASSNLSDFKTTYIQSAIDKLLAADISGSSADSSFILSGALFKMLANVVATSDDTFNNLSVVAGVEWDQVADSYNVLGSNYSYYDTIRPCLVTPGNEGAGDVTLNPYDYTHDTTGYKVALDGSQGQVMMRFPQLFYDYEYLANTHSWRISNRPETGYALHPAFMKGGVEVPYRYVGIYPACGYDVSEATYVDGDGVNSWLDKTNDKLGSVVGFKPLSNFTRAQGRAMAANVGTGWQMMDFWLYAMMKLLYITKHADLDSQSVLGAGNTRWSGGFDFETMISATGKVLSIDAPGQSTLYGNAGDYCNLLGIENPFGDIWEFVDGWNILDGANYVCSDPADFADNTTTNYAQFGSTNPTSSGWQNLMQPNVAMLPASVGASDATKFCDYYSYASGWRVALVGGGAGSGSDAGLSSLDADGASSGARSYGGGRLCF